MAKNFTSPGETTIGALASDGTPRHLKLDTATTALTTIDYAHHEVHAGSHFFYTDKTSLDTSATTDYIIAAPNTTKWAHMRFNATGSAITQVDLYESCTRTGTTDVVVYNNNRNSTDSATVVIYKGSSTDGSDGTLIWTKKSGTAERGSRSTAEMGQAAEIILKQNIKYLFRFTSSSSDNLCNLHLEWYEHTNAG
jgi:hypothetical protein